MPATNCPAPQRLTKQDFEALSDFRFQLRRFERFSENAAKAEGITALQYFLLLHIKGCRGRDWASVGELADRLQAQPHGGVALVSRCEALSLVEPRTNVDDRRIVEVHLMAKVRRELAAHGLDRLPVVANAQSRRLVGRVSRSDCVKTSLTFFGKEERREMFRRTPLRMLKARYARAAVKRQDNTL